MSIPATARSSARINHGRRGSTYIAALGLGLILTIVGIAIVALSRVGTRSMRDTGDWAKARQLALSGAEHALTKINSDSNWRTSYQGQTVTHSLGGGSFSWQVIDEADGDLTDDEAEPVTVVATGTVGEASYTLRGQLEIPVSGGAITHGITAPTKIQLSGNASIDSYDSSLGSYGGTNKGSNASIATNTTVNNGVKLTGNAKIKGDVAVGPGGDPDRVISASGSAITGDRGVLDEEAEIPAPTEPTGMGSSTGHLNVRDRTVFISEDRHVNKLKVSGNGRLRITGDATILADGEVSVSGNGRIEVMSGASLKIYCKNKLKLSGNGYASVVDGSDLSRLQFIGLGTGRVQLSGNGWIQGVVLAPYAAVRISGNGSAFGAVVAKNLKMSGNGKIHEDTNVTGGADPVGGDGGADSSSPIRPISWNQSVE